MTTDTSCGTGGGEEDNGIPKNGDVGKQLGFLIRGKLGLGWVKGDLVETLNKRDWESRDRHDGLVEVDKKEVWVYDRVVREYQVYCDSCQPQASC